MAEEPLERAARLATVPIDQAQSRLDLPQVGLLLKAQGPPSSAFEEALKRQLAQRLPELEWFGSIGPAAPKGPDDQWLVLEYDLQQGPQGLRLSLRLIHGLRFPSTLLQQKIRVASLRSGPAPKVAVLDIYGPDLEGASLRQMSKSFRQKLTEQIGPEWLAAQGVGQGPQGCFLADCARALARSLGADLLVLPSLERKRSRWVLSAWVYDTAGDRPVAMEETKLPREPQFAVEARHLAHRVMRRHRVWFSPRPQPSAGERTWSPPVLYRP